MQPALPALAGFEGMETAELKLVIVYDDVTNRQHALDFLDGLIESFGRFVTFLPRFLNFEDFGQRHFDPSAAQAAGLADMVVIVAREEAELPGQVEHLLRAWKGDNRAEDGALVALLRPASAKDTGPQASVRSRLHDVANRTGRTFMCRNLECTQEPTDSAVDIARQTLESSNHGLEAPALAI
jgi:hypothetical protein